MQKFRDMEKRKTIFITITKGILARNILRTPVLRFLSEEPGVKIIILMQQTSSVPLPQYFFDEFLSDNVAIEILPPKKTLGWEKAFNYFASKLVFSRSTKINLLYNGRVERRISRASYIFLLVVFKFLGFFPGIKNFCRWLDLKLFSEPVYCQYFEKYKPDLIFSTCIMSQFDVAILKEAKRRGIKTISMPRSWDNLDKFFFRVEPDRFMVQNEIMKKETTKHQLIAPEKITVIGFPQFDYYIDKSIISPRQEYCVSRGFNPDLPILFLGSEGAWTKGWDENIFRAIIESRDAGIIQPCNILIRPHPSDCHQHNFHIFDKYQMVFIDDKFRHSDFFNDHWDPSLEDMKDFANTLHHCDLSINFASTLALDAACFNKPIISVDYGNRFLKGRDISRVIHQTCHYQWVLETGAVYLAKDESDLMKKINYYLINPEADSGKRKKLVEKLCYSGQDDRYIGRTARYKLDGQSSKRLAEAVLKS